ncbi:hypothetical protein [Legionella oakridgensis]|uniref:hypothetical protein n=1 Tax=Legionella oakridgensis TaxID=29423 RepID=UPI00046D8CD9|nr:hypothetical protein [Legionella oakridgensis]
MLAIASATISVTIEMSECVFSLGNASVLLSVNNNPNISYSAIKGMHNDCNSINDKSQIASEVQAGFGYSIKRWVSLSLSYQGISGGN